jgi:hypothetical protein
MALSIDDVVTFTTAFVVLIARCRMLAVLWGKGYINIEEATVMENTTRLGSLTSAAAVSIIALVATVFDYAKNPGFFSPR